jgi:hypothetical protein
MRPGSSDSKDGGTTQEDHKRVGSQASDRSVKLRILYLENDLELIRLRLKGRPA